MRIFGIYSTYSTRSSIHFLARCSNFSKPLKNSEFCPLNLQAGEARNSLSDQEWQFSTFFSSEMRWQFEEVGYDSYDGRSWYWKPKEACSLFCNFWWSEALSCRKQFPAELHVEFFSQNNRHLHKQWCVVLSVDSLILCNIWKEEDALLIPKNRGENFSSGFLHSKNFGTGLWRFAATPLIFALSLGHCDITRFFPWLPNVTRNHLHCANKFPYFAHTTGTTDFLIHLK